MPRKKRNAGESSSSKERDAYVAKRLRAYIKNLEAQAQRNPQVEAGLHDLLSKGALAHFEQVQAKYFDKRPLYSEIEALIQPFLSAATLKKFRTVATVTADPHIEKAELEKVSDDLLSWLDRVKQPKEEQVIGRLMGLVDTHCNNKNAIHFIKEAFPNVRSQYVLSKSRKRLHLRLSVPRGPRNGGSKYCGS